MHCSLLVAQQVNLLRQAFSVVDAVPSSDPRIDDDAPRYFDIHQLSPSPTGLYMAASINPGALLARPRLWKYDGESIRQVDGCLLSARDEYIDPGGICGEDFLQAHDLVATFGTWDGSCFLSPEWRDETK